MVLNITSTQGATLYISLLWGCRSGNEQVSRQGDKVATEKVIRHTNASSRSNILQHVQNPAKSKGSQRYFLQFQRKITETELKGIPWKSQRIPQDGMSIAIP